MQQSIKKNIQVGRFAQAEFNRLYPEHTETLQAAVSDLLQVNLLTTTAIEFFTVDSFIEIVNEYLESNEGCE